MTLYQKWIAYKTIVCVELKRLIRIWTQTLLPPAVTSVLYFVIFGKVIGSRVGIMDGRAYIQFIMPGLIMMNVITSSYACSVSAFFSAKFQRHIEELLVAPVSNVIILLGYMSGGIVRGLIVGIIVMAIACIFVGWHVHSFTAIVITALLSSSIFSLAGIINAVYAKSFDDISLIPTFILTPLTYLGGVFYSVTLLPPFWQYLTHVNPITYIIDNFRFGFLGIKDNYLIFSYVLMLGLFFILFGSSYYLMQKGIGLRE